MLSHVLQTRSVQTRSVQPATPEPRLVIEHREALIYMICEAAELEHGLMCEYLFAAFSLKDRVDEGVSEDQLAAIQRWRSTIFGVAAQEMLHLALTANMLTALGASPHLSRPNLPQPARHYPASVRLALLPFGEQALRHFLYLERPEGIALDDAEGLAAVGEALPVMGEEEIVPRGQDFATVGHLYRSIESGFGHLVEKLGADRVFIGPPQAQITQANFSWPQLVPITDLASATAAIEAIVEQGEGPRGDWRQAHFGRFKGVLDEFLALRQVDPGFEPARPVAVATVRPGEGDSGRLLISDPVTAKVADLGNVVYEVLLQMLYRLLSRIDESDAEIATLADVAVGLMMNCIEPLGNVLTALPVGPSAPGATAGVTFELFYQPDYLLPHRRAAWLLISERLAQAAELAAHLSDTVSALDPIATSLAQMSDKIGAETVQSAG
jgi:Ferritin-like